MRRQHEGVLIPEIKGPLTKKVYLVTSRYGVEMDEPRVFYTEEEAKEYITTSVYEYLTGINDEAMGKLEEDGIDRDNSAAVFAWAEKNDFCTSYNVEGLIDTATVGDDWLEFKLTELDIQLDKENA